MLESTRAKEEAVKRETSEQLDLFRRQQEQAEKALLDEGVKADDRAGSPTGPSSDTQWGLNARKRKRVKDDKALKRVQIRKSSSTAEDTSKFSERPSANSELPQKKISGESGSITSDGRETNKPQKATQSQNLTPHIKASSHIVPNDTIPAKPGALPGLGLAGYSSDDD